MTYRPLASTIALLITGMVGILRPTAVNSQSFNPQLIEVDSVTNFPKSTLPFDERVVLKLKLPADGNKIKGFNVFQLNKHGRPKALSRYAYRNLFVNDFYDPEGDDSKRKQYKDFKNRVPRRSAISEFITEVKADKKNLYLTLPPLNPGADYKIQVGTYDEAIAADFKALLYQMQTDFAAAQTSFNALKAKYDFLDSVKWQRDIVPFRNSYQKLIADNTTHAAQISGFSVKFFDDAKAYAVREFTQKYIVNDTFSSEKINEAIYSQHAQALKPFRDVLFMNSTTVSNFLTGEWVFSGELNTENVANLERRKQNILKSIANLKGCIQLVNLLIVNNIKAKAGSFATLSNEMNQMLEFLATKSLPHIDSSIAEEEKGVSRLMEKTLPINYRAATVGTTMTYDFKTRNKLQIIPDFGLQFMFDGADLIDNTQLVPFAGFHINLRPINKNVPFRMVQGKTILHRISFNSALTFTSLAESGKRENFFKKNSLMTGLGIRITNGFGITAGATWFRSIRKYPVAKKELSMLPYIGFSIDLELQELFGNIKNIFTP